MTEDERDDLIDRLPDRFTIWADEQEIPGRAEGRDIRWWLDTLGHEKAHAGCCKACGCCTTCLAGAFYDAVVSSVIRELDKVGALVSPRARALLDEGGET